MLGVPHCNSKKITARSRTARTARTALVLGFCTAALTLSAGAAAASAPAAGDVVGTSKLVNGWD
ncbi:hypothetical protein ACFT9I_05305 [Streptomyces sp. NPDC057137]|uniref:hypothetical protein n=1 Tax=unclassified Streptomyces TaxID=2593676 RepID=UPI003642C368